MELKEKKAFEPSGLVPRSIVRTFERFRQQLLPGSETAAIREYRISRYQVLVSARCLFTLLIIPIATNWLVSSWLLSPLVEHFWNTQQNEIFVNSYQEERAFAELESFSEKLFFESLLNTTNTINVANLSTPNPFALQGVKINPLMSSASPYLASITSNTDPLGTPLKFLDSVDKEVFEVMFDSLANYYNPPTILSTSVPLAKQKLYISKGSLLTSSITPFATELKLGVTTASPMGIVSKANLVRGSSLLNIEDVSKGFINEVDRFEARKSTEVKDMQVFTNPTVQSSALLIHKPNNYTKPLGLHVQQATDSSINKSVKGKPLVLFPTQLLTPEECKSPFFFSFPNQPPYQLRKPIDFVNNSFTFLGNREEVGYTPNVGGFSLENPFANEIKLGTQSYNQELNILGIASNSLSAKQKWRPATALSSSVITSDNSLNVKEKVQNKILELAIYYNQQTIISITNIIGDIVSLVTLGCLFIWMKPEITILKSFLIEAIYSLSDTTKSFLLILLTDLLVGFHSPRGWETALELLLKHFGLPENQDFVFLFVATFPVLLDTVFKYWIFRHLNKISPSTVATYHSMIE